MSTPRNGQLIGTVTYTDGTPFDGFALIGLAVPVNGSSIPWPAISKGAGTQPTQRLPLWARIPILGGAYDANSYLWYNADLTPPNTAYCLYFYDKANVQVASYGVSPVTLFTISAPTTTINFSTIPLPTAAAVAPTPEV